MDKQSIYIRKKEATETPLQKVYKGGPKAYTKKGLKQKQTSPPDELEKTQNQCYKYDCINKKLKIRKFKIKIQ